MKYLYKISIIKLFEIIYGKVYRSKKKIDNKELKITNLNFLKKILSYMRLIEVEFLQIVIQMLPIFQKIIKLIIFPINKIKTE